MYGGGGPGDGVRLSLLNKESKSLLSNMVAGCHVWLLSTGDVAGPNCNVF